MAAMVKEDVLKNVDSIDTVLQAGMIDEADEVYLNGVRVGQTGISSSEPRVRGLIIVGTVKKEAPTPQPDCRTSTPSVHLQ